MSKAGWLGGAIALIFILMAGVRISPAQTGGSSSPGISTSPQSQAGSLTPTPTGEGQGQHPRLLLTYVLLVVFFVTALHVIDAVQAYQISRRQSAAILNKLPASLSADDLLKVQQALAAYASPAGIAGTTRSILTYALIIILGIAVFHLLALPPSDAKTAEDYAAYADKLLILLAGSLTTAVGFYFGAKATTEGVDAGRDQDGDQTATLFGHIDTVDPSHGTIGNSIVIKGTGFGTDTGNVQFGDVAVPTVDSWSETSITVKVPPGLHSGKVDISVNPAHGNRITGKDVFTVDETQQSPTPLDHGEG